MFRQKTKGLDLICKDRLSSFVVDKSSLKIVTLALLASTSFQVGHLASLSSNGTRPKHSLMVI